MTETAMDALASLMSDTFRTNYELLQIMDGATDPRDRRKAHDAIVRNEHTLTRVAQYMAKPPSFTWHLVTTPISWHDEHLAKDMAWLQPDVVPLVELSIHT